MKVMTATGGMAVIDPVKQGFNLLVLASVLGVCGVFEAEAVSQGDNWSAERMGLNHTGFRHFRIGEVIDPADPTLIVQGELNPECDYARVKDVRGDMYFMIIEGVLVRIDVDGRAPGGTVRGETLNNMLGVDSGVDEIRDAYGDRVTTRPNKYGVGTDYVVDLGADRGAVFETEEGRVTSFRVGQMEQVLWVEGCS